MKLWEIYTMSKMLKCIKIISICAVLYNGAYSDIRNMTNSTALQPTLLNDIFEEDHNVSDISGLLKSALNGDKAAMENIQFMAIYDCSSSLAQQQDERCFNLSLQVYEGLPSYFKSLVSFIRFKYLSMPNQVNLLFSPDNNLVRQVYNQMITSIYEQEFKVRFAKKHDNGLELSQSTIKDAINARNNTKVALQSLTSVTGQIGIYLRNYYKYGSIYGPYTKFSFVCESGYLCYEPSFSEDGSKNSMLNEIDAYKAFKTDGGDLGLVGNNFGEKIEIAKQLNKECTLGTRIYPEAISDDYVKCYQQNENISACQEIDLMPSKLVCVKGEFDMLDDKTANKQKSDL